MRKTLVFLGLCLAISSLSAQTQPLIILGDKVPVYNEASHHGTIVSWLNWDAKIVGYPISSTWYGVRDQEGNEGFVDAWYALEEWMTDEETLRAKRVNPSASTLYRMMRFFKRNGKIAKAEDFSLRIIKDHNEEEFPGKDKACYKLGHLAYIEMVADDETGVIYTDYLMSFTEKVLDVSNTPSIQAMALYHRARYLALNGNPDAGFEALLQIVEHHPEAFARNECEPEKLDSWYYKPERTKRLFCALSMIHTPEGLEIVQSRLEELIMASQSTSQAMAQELLSNLGTMPYPRDESMWY